MARKAKEAEQDVAEETAADGGEDVAEGAPPEPADPRVDKVASAVYGATVPDGMPWDDLPDAAREQFRARARQHIAATEAMG